MLSADQLIELMEVLDSIQEGQLPDHARSRIYDYLDEPSQFHWEEAFSIRVTPESSLWQAVINQDYPVRMRRLPWRALPTFDQTMNALRAHAQPKVS